MKTIWKTCTFYTFDSLMYSLLPWDTLFKTIFDFATAGGWDCVAALVRFPVFHYSVVFRLDLLKSWNPLWNIEAIWGSLIRPKWQTSAILAQHTCTLYTFSKKL